MCTACVQPPPACSLSALPSQARSPAPTQCRRAEPSAEAAMRSSRLLRAARARAPARSVSTAARPRRSIFRDLEPATATALLRTGYAVVRDAVDAPTCAALRREIDALAAMGALSPNETLFVPRAGPVRRAAKPNISEAEMHVVDAAAAASAPTLSALREDAALGATLSCFAPELTLDARAVKAQVNAGSGGCFPIHVDSDPSVDRRRVTAILYLNRGWDAARDGGALRLFPFPRPRGAARAVDVAPREGTLVLLSANEMHHRVLPAFARRYCVTVWMMGRVSPRVRKPPPLPADCRDLRRIFCAPRYRKHVARVALGGEWEESLRDAHAAHDAASAVEAHRREVAKICAVLADEIARKFPHVTGAEVAAALADLDRLVELMSVPEGEDDPVLQWFV